MSNTTNPTMSNTTNPMTQFFELQRTAVEQTQQATHESLTAQQNAVGQIVEAIEQWSDLSERTLDATEETVRSYLDSVAAASPDEGVDFDEFEAFLDESFETLSANQQEAVEALLESVEQGSESYNESLEAYTEAVDSSFDVFLDAHERAEADLDEAADEFDVQA